MTAVVPLTRSLPISATYRIERVAIVEMGRDSASQQQEFFGCRAFRGTNSLPLLADEGISFCLLSISEHRHIIVDNIDRVNII